MANLFSWFPGTGVGIFFWMGWHLELTLYYKLRSAAVQWIFLFFCFFFFELQKPFLPIWKFPVFGAVFICISFQVTFCHLKLIYLKVRKIILFISSFNLGNKCLVELLPQQRSEHVPWIYTIWNSFYLCPWTFRCFSPVFTSSFSHCSQRKSLDILVIILVSLIISIGVVV